MHQHNHPLPASPYPQLYIFILSLLPHLFSLQGPGPSNIVVTTRTVATPSVTPASRRVLENMSTAKVWLESTAKLNLGCYKSGQLRVLGCLFDRLVGRFVGHLASCH
jgi:hypothetical protein